MPVTLSEVINNSDMSPQIRNAVMALMPRFIKVVLSPAIVAANTTAEQTFTVNGLAVGDFVYVNKPTAQAGIGIVGARVSAVNQIGITFSNNTVGGLTPTATETYLIGQIPALLNPIANTNP